MIVDDAVLFLFVGFLACLFAVLGFDGIHSAHNLIEDTEKQEEEEIRLATSLGRMLYFLKIFFFLPLSAGMWYVLAVMSITLNNCTWAFANQCWTSPTYATTTTAVGNPLGIDLGIAFGFIGTMFVLAFIIIMIWFSANGLLGMFRAAFSGKK